MSGNDLTATISTRLNGTLGALDQTQRKVLGLRDSLLAVNRAGQATAPVLGRALVETGRRADQAATRAARGQATTAKAVAAAHQRTVAQATGAAPAAPAQPPAGDQQGADGSTIAKAVGKLAGRMGGKAKELAKPLDGNDLFGAYSRLAAGIGLVTIAYKAMAAVEQANIDRLQQQIEFENKLQDVRKAGVDARRAAARDGLSTADRERALLADPGDLARRNQLAGEFGIDDATAAVLRARKAGKRGASDAALRIATALARTGAFSLDEAMAEIEQTKVRPTDRNADLLARRLYRERTGGDLATDGAEAAQRIANDPLQRVARANRAIESQAYLVKQQRAVEEGDQAAREDLARLRSPETAAMLAAYRESSQKLDELHRLADMQGLLSRIVDNTGMLLGGKGSMSNQIERTEIARGAAWIDPAGKP